eukprot:scaffold1668_cov113-Isochrysis_galbana.AAC.3
MVFGCGAAGRCQVGRWAGVGQVPPSARRGASPVACRLGAAGAVDEYAVYADAVSSVSVSGLSAQCSVLDERKRRTWPWDVGDVRLGGRADVFVASELRFFSALERSRFDVEIAF